MSKKYEHIVDRCLIVPDIHQDIAWVDRILEQESEFDLLVLLGDYFDSWKKSPEVGTVKQVSQYLLNLKERFEDRVVFLLGNHDVSYLEAKRFCDQHRNPKKERMRYYCSGYSNNNAKDIAKSLDYSFWDGCRLFVMVNGYMLSHAGLAGYFYRYDCSTEEAIESFDALCDIAQKNVQHADFAILKPGPSRTDMPTQPIGGIVWQDWQFEFLDDELPFPQIVGHTQCTEFGKGARKKGRSWCIDGAQSCYAVLERDELQIREA